MPAAVDKQRQIRKHEADKAEALMQRALGDIHYAERLQDMPKPCRMIHALGMRGEHYHAADGSIIQRAA